MSNSNVIKKEIQELIQQIKNEYQEGIDYNFADEIYKESAEKGKT